MITILMASYNGENFIAEQIDSLLAQSFQDFRLIIRDDCSTDSTLEIARDYAARYPDKIFTEKNGENSGSAALNFMGMLVEHRDDYIMLCDQDDIWLPRKVETTLDKMRELEAELGAGIPLLVHTDMTVTDESMRVASPSYRAMVNLDYKKKELRNLVAQNILTGCTVMYNRTLSGLIKGIPPFFLMHDWWLALMASAFGKMASIDEPTVLYRQHESNAVGAPDIRSPSYAIGGFLRGTELKKALEGTYLQAQNFLGMFSDRLNGEQKALLMSYADIPNHGKLERCATLCRLGTFKNGVARKIGQLLYI